RVSQNCPEELQISPPRQGGSRMPPHWLQTQSSSAKAPRQPCCAQRGFATYELFADPPLPLVRRSLRLPVKERTRADGSVLKAVDAEEIARIAARLKLEDVKSVAI